MIRRPAASASLLPRGVHPLHVLSEHGNPVFVAVDRHHRYIGWAEVTPGADYAATRSTLAAALELADPAPPDVLDGARHLRLVRFDPYVPRPYHKDAVPF